MNKCIRYFTLLSFPLFIGCGTTSEIKLNEPVTTSSKMPSAQVSNSPGPQGSITPIQSQTPEAKAVVSPEPVIQDILKIGDFKNFAHKVSGIAKIIKVENKNILRLENFNTENGPALVVYLVKNSNGNPASSSDYINLGSLKSTNGNFNYDLPDKTNINEIQSVTIWCQAFSVKFGFAQLFYK